MRCVPVRPGSPRRNQPPRRAWGREASARSPASQEPTRTRRAEAAWSQGCFSPSETSERTRNAGRGALQAGWRIQYSRFWVLGFWVLGVKLLLELDKLILTFHNSDVVNVFDVASRSPGGYGAAQGRSRERDDR